MVQARHAEIIGAGFGGLVAAIALRERGWTVRVHERRASLAGEGYGIAVHKNMAHIFARFGILDEVLSGGMRIDRRDSINSRGHVVMTRPTTRSRYRIDREHIIALLAERAIAGGAEIRFSSPVSSASPDGTLTLTDGSQCAADLVVAADGVNSSIRNTLGLLEERRWGRDWGVRVTIPREPVEVAADDHQGTFMIEAWADRRRVLYCPVTKREWYVLLTCTESDTAARSSPIDPTIWSQSFPTLAELFVRIRQDADWTQARWDHFQTVRLKRWWRGRVAVLGDAAHAMPPYLAQGGGHAMMSAVGLAAALDETRDMEAAFQLWETRERPLAEHTQRWTSLYGRTMFLPKPLKAAWILVEKIPWVARQYVRVANHVPTGCPAIPLPREV